MTSRSRFALTALCALSLGLLTPAALHADSCAVPDNLVQNCSFGTKSFTNWTVSRAASGSALAIFSGAGYNGDNAAGFATGTQYDTIAQTLSTTPGEDYTLSFWLDNTQNATPPEGALGPMDFQALWNGVSLLNLSEPTYGTVEYTFTVDGTGSDTLSFEGDGIPFFYELSDVSLTPDGSAVTPEPSSFLLLGTGLLGFAGLLRRRYARN